MSTPDTFDFFSTSLARTPLQDFALDLHTQSTGTDYPIFLFSDYRDPMVQVIAENLCSEMIKIDAGESMSYTQKDIGARTNAQTHTQQMHIQHTQTRTFKLTHT